jgi:hypothetical protein
MSLRLFEFFGFAPEDTSPEATEFRKTLACPFVGGTCIKRFKSGTVSGACSVKQVKSGPVICCPNRMYADNYRVLLDVAQACFGSDSRLCRSTSELKGDGNDVQVFGKRWGKELRLPSRGVGGAYFVDWILALVGPNRKLKEFVAVELQTMDTTGSYEAEVNALHGGEAPGGRSKAGINWENVSKRILPQIIYKGHVLRREHLCTKGLFFICPTPVYQRILERLGGRLEDYSPQAGALTFRWYDLDSSSREGTPRSLVSEGQYTTTVDQVAHAFVSPSNLPARGVYEQAIQAALNASTPP